MKLRIGDRVKLITKNWGISEYNPVWEHHHIRGTVTDIERHLKHEGDLPCEVEWDNGRSNQYNYENLEVIDSFLRVLDVLDDI